MNIKSFLKAHPALNYAADLKVICAPLYLLDIVYFSHASIDKNGCFSGLGIAPEFFRLYFEKGYYNFDLHMTKPSPGEHYILWDTIVKKNQSNSLHTDFMSFNQGHTFSIVIEHESGKDCYHFATHLGNETMNGEYLQMIESLKKFISYFKEKIRMHKELSKAYSLKIPLQKEGYFSTESSGIDIQKFHKNIQSNRIYLPTGNHYLTKRELECLSWFAKGKTIEETSKILQISPRTIKAHMLAIREKSGCSNQFQLGMYYANLICSGNQFA